MTKTLETQDIHEKVKHYYGEILADKGDLKTDACCSSEAMPLHARAVIPQIEAEILNKFYGCGSPLPLALEGTTVLDLGCGTGRDAYIAAKLVGPAGRVYGIDMTSAQLEVAQRHLDSQMDRFGYAQPNISFHQGYIEDLTSANIADESIDVVISNCVINLAPDKTPVFSEIFRVLKTGGELYFSDIFAGRRIPRHLADDPILRGECLGGALYIEDFRRMLQALGCLDYRVVSQSPLQITNDDVADLAGMIDFYTMTIRVFKLPLEDICENYGQVAYYRGTIAHAPHAFTLDNHHHFKTGMPLPVCGNTADMLAHSRLAPHFHIHGDKSVHFGAFNCTTPVPPNQAKAFGACC